MEKKVTVKYINSEKLYKQVDELMAHFAELEKETKPDDEDLSIFYQGKVKMCSELFGIIDSLQQKQPDFPTTDEQVKEFLATHPKIKVPEKYKNPDWLFKKQEQSEVDLEEEYKTWWKSISGKINVEHIMEWYMHETARHFYELGLKARKEE